MPAYMRLKLVGSGSMSVALTIAPTSRGLQVAPPSVERKRPRGGRWGLVGPRPAMPRLVAATRTSAFAGSTLTSLNEASAKVAVASTLQVAPPSVDLRRPAPS